MTISQISHYLGIQYLVQGYMDASLIFHSIAAFYLLILFFFHFPWFFGYKHDVPQNKFVCTISSYQNADN